MHGKHADTKTENPTTTAAAPQTEAAPVAEDPPFTEAQWAVLKRWVRREIDLHAVGVDHNERELQNP